MAYTREQINRISADRKASAGIIYVQDNGDKYKGQSDGRLEKIFTSDTNVSAQPDLTENPVRLSTYLANLEVFNSLTEDFLNSYKFAQKTGYKVFTYTGDNITEQNIYTDSTMSDLLYTVVYTYTGDKLTQVQITKADGSFTLTKTLAYDVNNNLTNITLT